MGELVFKDDMKKLSKRFIVVGIFLIVLTIGLPVAFQFRDPMTTRDIIRFAIIFGVSDLTCLFALIHTLVYKLEVYQDAIKIRTMFKRTNIEMANVVSYSKVKNALSSYYSFRINYNDVRMKSITIHTTHIIEFDKLLANQVSSNNLYNN